MKRILVGLIWLASGFMPSYAHATFMELLGVNDTLDRGIAGLQDVVDRTRNAAFAIEARSYQDGQKLLAQIDQTVKDATRDLLKVEKGTVEDIDKVLSKYMKSFSDLESKTMADLAELLSKAQCAFENTLSRALITAIQPAP
jgi:hypothetical protein